jgi:hypothetical protein
MEIEKGQKTAPNERFGAMAAVAPLKSQCKIER